MVRFMSQGSARRHRDGARICADLESKADFEFRGGDTNFRSTQTQISREIKADFTLELEFGFAEAPPPQAGPAPGTWPDPCCRT